VGLCTAICGSGGAEDFSGPGLFGVLGEVGSGVEKAMRKVRVIGRVGWDAEELFFALGVASTGGESADEFIRVVFRIITASPSGV
jgi:hypothetical protein